MKLLKAYIKEKGCVGSPDVLKVDSFLNHQIDPILMNQIALHIKEHFQHQAFDKIVTVESSGIAPAVLCGLHMQLPVVCFKKAVSSNLGSECYQAHVHSFTKNKDYTMFANKQYISENENILFIDDFLANGEAAFGVIDILDQAKANLKGIAILIEKSFQPGRKRLDEAGYEVYSLARIKHMAHGSIEFL